MNFQKIKTAVFTLLGIDKTPIKAGKTAFTDEQKASVVKTFGAEKAEEIFAAFDEEVEQSAGPGNPPADNPPTDPAEGGEGGNGQSAEETVTTEQLQAVQTELATAQEQNQTLVAERQRLEQTIAVLSDEPEEDPADGNPQAGVQLDPRAARAAMRAVQGVLHSKTHVFASGENWDQAKDRPWNQRALGQTAETTAFTKVDIDKINEDLGAYYRQDTAGFISFLRGKSRLPSFWPVISNVIDEKVYKQMFTGEVTQARKKKWLPKSSTEIQPEIAKVYPIQIDLEWAGYELQAMEESWLAGLNKEGSSAYKLSFIKFVLQEMLKKAREEDEIGAINGIYNPTADDADVPSLAIHKMRGLRKLFREKISENQIHPMDIGTPTPTTIVAYVDSLVMNIPEYWRDLPGMVFYMSSFWFDCYQKDRETKYGLMPTYNPGKTTVMRHENIRIEVLPFLDNTNLMFVTPDDNIVLLEYIPSEESFITLEMLKRVIYGIGDYKKGIYMPMIGRKLDDGDTPNAEEQMVFMNKVEDLTDKWVPVADDVVKPSVKYHNTIKLGENTGATAITDLADYKVGEYIYIYGNGTTNASTIATGGKFDLTGNITLNEDTLLVLYVRGTDDFVEYKRITLNEPEAPVTLAADATTADADNGSHFITSANTGATALTNISNAVEGEEYVLEGGSDTNATTIAKAGNFSRISAAITLSEGNWIKMRYNGTAFVELDRYVAA